MRSFPALFRAPPSPPRSVWTVRTVEHHAALRAVDDALTAVVDALRLTNTRAETDTLSRLVDAADAYAQRGGGTPCVVSEEEAQRLHLRCDLAKRLMGQLSARDRAPRRDRGVWLDRIAATLGEAMGPTP